LGDELLVDQLDCCIAPAYDKTAIVDFNASSRPLITARSNHKLKPFTCSAVIVGGIDSSYVASNVLFEDLTDIPRSYGQKFVI